MTDFRALCAELADELTQFNAWYIEDNGYGLPNLETLLRRCDAALAEPKPPCRYIYSPAQIAECGGPCEQGPKHCDCGELWMVEPEPAVPEGREPASVTEQPSNADLLKLAQQYSGVYLLSDGSAFHPFQEGYDMRNDVLNFARAVLARWGCLVPAPVPVSERLPEPEDCDEKGRCWWWHPSHPESGYLEGWMLRPRFWGVGHYDLDDRLTHTHWLPAHALPLPTAND